MGFWGYFAAFMTANLAYDAIVWLITRGRK